MDKLQAAVKKDVSNHKKPFAVIASAGTTNTGSIDPIADISALCKKYDMWLHVDGAIGASALLSDKHKKICPESNSLTVSAGMLTNG